MFEPFPGNYVWNLAINICLAMGAPIGELVGPIAEVSDAAARGSDIGTRVFFEALAGLAERVAAEAEADLASGHALSAGARYRRVCAYLMTAERMRERQDEARRRAFAGMLDAMARALALGALDGERVEVPFEGRSFPGLMVTAPPIDGRPAPCIVHCNGLDSVKEMIHLVGIADALRRRGVSTLMIDHPGSGEALRLRAMPGTHEAERWGSAALDYLWTRDDVDPNAIGILGWSLGGYFAPRTAAFDPRFALCAVWGANHDWGATQQRRLQREGENPVPHYWDHVMWAFGKGSLEEFMAWVPNMTLDGVVERITVPFLVTHGAGDRQIPVADAYRSFEQAVNSSKRELHIFDALGGGVEHCAADNPEPAKAFIADWIADTFAEIAMAGALKP